MARKSKEETEVLDGQQTDMPEQPTRRSAIADSIRTLNEEGYGSNAKYIRDMRLTSEQKSMIVNDEVKKILTSKRPEELQGGMIPCFIDYPVDTEGFTVLYTFIKADTRLVRMAWEYYKDNAENPKVKDFTILVQKIVGVGEQHKKVDHLHLN